MFEWLFKYPTSWFANGTVTLTWGVPTWITVSVVLTLLCYVLLNYGGIRQRLPGAKHAWVWLLRGALLSLLLFVLLNPKLVTEIQESVRGEILVLIDHSHSMSIQESGADTTRLAQTLKWLGPQDGTVAQVLRSDFNPRFLAFGRGVQPINNSTTTIATQGRSNLVGALEEIANNNSGDTPSAVVIASDGGLDSHAGLNDAIERIKALGVNIHTLSVGQATVGKDLELSRVSGPTQVLRGDTIDLDVDIAHSAMAGEQINISVEEDGQIISQQTLTVPGNDSTSRVPFQLPLDSPGVRRLEFVVSSDNDELIAQNNRMTHTVVVRDRKFNVLHFEGEPRFEVKFTRRALADDDTVRLASLIRTAENKFYRLGILDSKELADGFPTKKEQLFAYDVLILGSVDAELLDTQRQELVREFVNERGGGLLLLGGARAFARGGYAGQPLEALMPVVLPKKASAYNQDLVMQPTPAGLRHSLLQIARDEPLTDLWQRLPPLTVINPLQQAKPAATVLLTATDPGGKEQIVMVEQPYGRGRVLALASRNTWRWQMDSKLPAKDPTHELLWRQMIRWLAREVDQRVRVTSSHDRAVQGDTITLTLEALNKDYQPDDSASIDVHLTDPSGSITAVRAFADSTTPGRYQAQFSAQTAGYYEVETVLHDSFAADEAPKTSGDAESLDTVNDAETSSPSSESSETTLPVRSVRHTTGIFVNADGEEYFNAGANHTFMQTLASQGGGQSFTSANVDQLPTALKTNLSTRPSLQRLSLWNAPVFMIGLILLACIEWLLRRRWMAV